VNRCGDEFGEIRLDRPAAPLRHAELTAEQRLRGGRPEQHQHARFDDLELGLKPRPARRHLRPVRLLMNAPLAARLPLEVLHRVRDVGRVAVDACFDESLVE